MNEKPPGLEESGPDSRDSRCKGPGAETIMDVQETARRSSSQRIKLEVGVREVVPRPESGIWIFFQ